MVVQPYLKADQPSSKDFFLGGVLKKPLTKLFCESLGVPSALNIQFKHYPTLLLLPVL